MATQTVGVPLSGDSLLPILNAIFCALCINIYIVGINQVMDIEIDKINKPELPIAAGSISPLVGTIISLVMCTIGLNYAYLQGHWLLNTLLLVGLIGTAYSLPPFNFKYNALTACFSICFARGIVGNLGMYLHFQTMLGGDT